MRVIRLNGRKLIACCGLRLRTTISSRCPKSLCAKILCIGSCLLFAGTIAAQENQNDDAAELPLSEQQTMVAERFSHLEKLLLRSSELQAVENPTRSALLQQAARLGKQNELADLLARASENLSKGQFSEAVERQKASRKFLQELLELLQSENREKRIREDREQVRRWIEDTNRLLRLQSSLRGRTEGGQSSDKAAQDQQRLADKAQDIAKDLGDGEESSGDSEVREPKDLSDTDEQGKESEGAENGKNSEDDSEGGKNAEGTENASDGASKGESPDTNQDGEQQSDEAGEQKSNPERSTGDRESKEGKSEANGKESKGSGDSSDKESEGSESAAESNNETGEQSEGGENSNGESEQGESSQGEKSEQGQQAQQGQQGQQQGQQGQQQAQTPAQRARQRIQQAKERMRQAKESLKDANDDEEKRKEAIEQQLKAEENLRAAIEELKQILRQLREEEIERSLASLEERLRQMLELQNKVLDESNRLLELAGDNPNRQIQVRISNLALEEKKVLAVGERAFLLLRDEGSSAAFPEAMKQLNSDVVQVIERLELAKLDKLTIAVEEEIVSSLEEMVNALVAVQKENAEKKKRQQQQGTPQQMQQGEQPLVDKLAELRLILTLQTRINKRTKSLSEMLEDPTDLIGQVESQDILESLKLLSERQAKIQGVTRNVANEVQSR